MQMGTQCHSSAANRADDVAWLHLLSAPDIDRLDVTVETEEWLAAEIHRMLDHNELPIKVEHGTPMNIQIIAGEDHLTGANRENGLTERVTDIDAMVK